MKTLRDIDTIKEFGETEGFELKIMPESMGSKQRKLVDLQKKMSAQLGASSAHLADVLSDMNKMVLEVILMTSTGWTELLGDGEFKNDDASTPIESSPPVGLSTYSVEELSSELELRGYTPPSSGLTNVPGTIENVTLPSGVPDWDLVPDVVLHQIVRDRDLFSIKDITDEAFFEEVTRRGVCQPSLEEFVDADIEREYWGRDLGAQEQEEEAGGWVFVFQPGVDTIKGFGLKIVKHALDLSGGASRRGSSQDASKLVGLTSNTVSAWAREHGWRDDPSKEDDSEE